MDQENFKGSLLVYCRFELENSSNKGPNFFKFLNFFFLKKNLFLINEIDQYQRQIK